MILPRSFYDRPTLQVAADLIGKLLVRCRRGRRTSGLIVEVESYIGESDPACHAAPGPTRRNRPLYGRPGQAYVYLNYGIHQLFNVVTEAEGSPAAVLIRALEPVEGIELMRHRRGRRIPVHDLCRGPGNLTVAMGITLAQNAEDLVGPHLFIEDNGEAGERLLSRDLREQPVSWEAIEWGPRIGINVGVDRHWRAYVSGHPAVSGPRRRGGVGIPRSNQPQASSAAFPSDPTASAQTRSGRAPRAARS